MSNRTLSALIFVLYNIGLFGAMLAVPVLAFLFFEIPNPNGSGRALLAVTQTSAIVLVGLAIVSRIAMRVFYNRVCGQAFAQWKAQPDLGDTVDALLLADLAGLSPQDAWNARQFLERRSAKIGLRYENADEPNRRRYRFLRSTAGSK